MHSRELLFRKLSWKMGSKVRVERVLLRNRINDLSEKWSRKKWGESDGEKKKKSSTYC